MGIAAFLGFQNDAPPSVDLIIKGSPNLPGTTKTYRILNTDGTFFTELRFLSAQAAENWIKRFGFCEEPRKKKR